MELTKEVLLAMLGDVNEEVTAQIPEYLEVRQTAVADQLERFRRFNEIEVVEE